MIRFYMKLNEHYLINNFLYYVYKTPIDKSNGHAKLRLSALKYDYQPLQKKTTFVTSCHDDIFNNSQFKYHEIYFFAKEPRSKQF